MVGLIGQVGIGWYVLGFFGGAAVFFFALGKLTSGSGADLVDWDPTQRQAARRAAADEDVEEMLEVANRRRRARGLADLTEEDVLMDLRRRRRQD